MTTDDSPDPEVVHDLVSYLEIAKVVELLPTLVQEKRRRDAALGREVTPCES